MPARAMLFSGDLYMQRYNPLTQSWAAEAGPFEANKFSIKPNSEAKIATSRGRASYGQAIETVYIQQPSDFSVVLTEVNKDTLSLGLLGTVAPAAADSPTAGDPAGFLISGSTLSQIRVRFRLEGTNMVDGTPTRVTVHEAVLSPDSEVDFLGADFATVSLKGTLKTPAGESEPYTVRVVA